MNMDIILMEQSMMNPNRGPASNTRFMNFYSSMPSLGQLMTSMDESHAMRSYSYGYNPHHHPYHLSSFSTQPPLLPFPANTTKPSPLPTKKFNNGCKNGGAKKKMNKSSKPSSSVLVKTTTTRSVSKDVTGKDEANGKKVTSCSSEEEFENECIYSLSPPPSSLPLPSLALMRPRVASCVVEAAGGAAGDLRRLLRL